MLKSLLMGIVLTLSSGNVVGYHCDQADEISIMYVCEEHTIHEIDRWTEEYNGHQSTHTTVSGKCNCETFDKADDIVKEAMKKMANKL